MGQPSYVISTQEITASVTAQGGHLAPVIFRFGKREIEPFSVAPWHDEKGLSSLPPVLKALRGDFFCLPFGGNDKPYRKEEHPVHGETANRKWKFEAIEETKESIGLHLSMNTSVRKGRVDKWIGLVAGHGVIYQRHIVSDMEGFMNFGHHATLKFPDREGAARLSTSPLDFGQVAVEPVEKPEQRGYSILKPGALFKDLRYVPTITGDMADLSRYPARRGYEDIAILVAARDLPLAWNALTFQEEGYVWFSLRDPRVLASTLLWMSNGGRHYPPWNGRHVNVMGVEDITSFFHYGIADSVRANSLSRLGVKTCVKLNPRRPLIIKYLMGVAQIPARFGWVENILTDQEGIILVGQRGKKVKVKADLGFLSR